MPRAVRKTRAFSWFARRRDRGGDGSAVSSDRLMPEKSRSSRPITPCRWAACNNWHKKVGRLSGCMTLRRRTPLPRSTRRSERSARDERTCSFLGVTRGRCRFLDQGSFCDPSENDENDCALCKEAEGAMAGQMTNIDGRLQASGGLRNRSSRYVTLLTDARTSSGLHTLYLSTASANSLRRMVPPAGFEPATP